MGFVNTLDLIQHLRTQFKYEPPSIIYNGNMGTIVHSNCFLSRDEAINSIQDRIGTAFVIPIKIKGFKVSTHFWAAEILLENLPEYFVNGKIPCHPSCEGHDLNALLYLDNFCRLKAVLVAGYSLESNEQSA